MRTIPKHAKQLKGHNWRFVNLIVPIEYIAIFLSLVLTGTIWIREVEIIQYLNTVRFLTLFAFLFLTVLYCHHYHTSPSNTAWLVIFLSITSAGLSYLISPGLRALLAAYTPIAILGLYCFSLPSRQCVIASLGRFINIVLAISLISLFFFFLGSVGNFISPSGTILVSWDIIRSFDHYYYFHADTQTIDFLGYSGIRNTGFFCEAPMFVFFLGAGLAIQNLILQRNYVKELVLVVTILTTFSTTGYVCIIIIYGYRILKLLMSRFSRRIKNASFVLLSLACLFALGILFSDKSDTGSFAVRSDHLRGCIQLFVTTFPFGVGFNNNDMFQSQFYYSQGLSVGLPYIIAKGGLLMLILSLTPFIFATHIAIHNKDGNIFTLMLCILWLTTTTAATSSPAFWMLIFLPLGRSSSLVAKRSSTKNLPKYEQSTIYN